MSADTPGSRDETAHAHPAAARSTGREHGRGETGGQDTVARRRHVTGTATAVKATENGSGDAATPERLYTAGSGAARVFVLSKDGQPLMPCHPARARELLGRQRAVIVRRTPFTIRLRDRTRAESTVQGVHLRIDPGSRGTGLMLTDDQTRVDQEGAAAAVRRGLFSVELRHRGDQIHARMQQRAGYRRRRRSAHCRYRTPRSLNRGHRTGWLPPSVRHRVDTTFSLAARLCRAAPVISVHVERVAFDLRSPEGDSSGATDTRGRLRAKWGNSCAYCGVGGVPLNVEHVTPRSCGGTSRLSNLVPACVPCNQAKGSRPVEDFLAYRPDRLAAVLQQAEAPLTDAATMNLSGSRLIDALRTLGRPVHLWSPRLTAANRDVNGLRKTHTLDALSVGPLDRAVGRWIVRFPERVLVATAAGRGSYARTTPDRYGFPRLLRERAKRHFGFVSGDLAQATVPVGKWVGTWTGHVSVRARGQHSLTTPYGRINVSHRNLRLLQRGDGYRYGTRHEPGVRSLGKSVDPSRTAS